MITSTRRIRTPGIATGPENATLTIWISRS
jgi:hypothetical protein